MTFDEWFEKSSKDLLKSAFNAGFEAGVISQKSKIDTTPPHIKYPTPSNPYPTPFTPNPWPNVTSCSKCGINLTGVIGYVCSDMRCPTFKKTWSGTITSGGPAVMGSGGSSGALGSNGTYIAVDIKR